MHAHVHTQQTRDIDPMLFQCRAIVFDVGPTIKQQWDNSSCLLGTHTPHGMIPHALLASDRRESRRQSGACSFKISPTTRNLFVRFNTGIEVGLSIFRRLISINVHCIYRRTHIKTFEDDMHYLQVNRGPWL